MMMMTMMRLCSRSLDNCFVSLAPCAPVRGDWLAGWCSPVPPLRPKTLRPLCALPAPPTCPQLCACVLPPCPPITCLCSVLLPSYLATHHPMRPLARPACGPPPYVCRWRLALLPAAGAGGCPYAPRAPPPPPTAVATHSVLLCAFHVPTRAHTTPAAPRARPLATWHTCRAVPPVPTH